MRKRIWFGMFFLTLVVLSGCQNSSEITQTTSVYETLTPLEITTQDENSDHVTETSEMNETSDEEALPEDLSTEETVESIETAVDYSLARDQYEAQYKKTQKLLSDVSKEKTQPAINIVTEDGKPKTDKTYIPAVADVFNCEEEFVLEGVNVQIKVRGNASANAKPYPYRIKFEKKQGMLGLNEGRRYRSWVLLKPYWTMCPNLLALNLAKAIFDGEYFVSDCRYVNLYMNGQYLGLYLLCEQHQTGEGRVEVHEPDKSETDVNIGYLVELDNNPDPSEHPVIEMDYHGVVIEDWRGNSREVSTDYFSVVSDTRSDGQVEYIDKYLHGVYDIIYEACVNGAAKVFDENLNIVDAPDGMTCEEAVKAVIDVRSFMNMLILEELVQNYDVGAGSFFMCVDFSEGAKYGKLTCTCPWDFNWGYTETPGKGFYACTWQKIEAVYDPVRIDIINSFLSMLNKFTGYDRSNVWFIVLMKADWFRAELSEYWQEISSSERLEEAMNFVADQIEACRGDLGINSKRVDKGYELMDYVRKRIEFLNKNL